MAQQKKQQQSLGWVSTERSACPHTSHTRTFNELRHNGQQITSLTAAMGKLILDTMSKSNIRRLVMEQQVYQLLLDMPLDEKQFLHFKWFGIYWRIGLGEQKSCRTASPFLVSLQLKLQQLQSQCKDFALTFYKFDITIGKSYTSNNETGAW